MNYTHYNHYVVMFIIMIISGLLSTMNIWANNSIDDIRFSLNDIYMIFLMTGWMFLFMGIYYKEILIFLFGFALVSINFFCIRMQFMIDTKQFMLGMIPHHSMAIHMSKKLLEKGTPFYSFAEQIIKAQEEEITYMKDILKKND